MSVIQLQLRRDTSANWTSNNPTLAQGEFGLETNTLAIKLGDGSTAWNSLSYYSSKMRTGSGNPAGGLGIIGDLYIDSGDGELYLKTAASTWTLQGNLTGPTGATGATGPAGAVNSVSAGSSKVSIGGTGAAPTVDVVPDNIGGISVSDPGTGVLEAVYPIQTQVTGNTKTFVVGDLQKWFSRANSGVAMTDALPVMSAARDGQSLILSNDDPTAAITLGAGAGQTFVNSSGAAGASSFTLKAGRRTQFVWNNAGLFWRLFSNNNNLTKGKSGTTMTLNNLAKFSTNTDGSEITDSGIAATQALTDVANIIGSDGQMLYYNGTNWITAKGDYNVVALGADPDNTTDSTVAFYNAITMCTTTSVRAKVTSQTTTSTSSFSLPVAANSLPASGNVYAQTTRGLVKINYTGGGGTTTLTTCTVTAGVAGGLLLVGQIVGVESIYQFGGRIRIPAGIYKTSYPIINSVPGIWFNGDSAGYSADVGTYYKAGGSWINYGGPAGQPALINVPMTGTSGIQGGMSLYGIRINGLNFLGLGTTGYGGAMSIGVQMISCTGYHMEDLYVLGACLTGFEWTTLGAATLDSNQAHDTGRGMAINLRGRQLEGKSTAANISAAVVTNPAATTNLNALSNSTITLSGAPNANWDTAGMAQFQARDALTGTVMWYLVSYTGISGSTLTGCNAVAQWWNQANSTTLNGATPTSGNPLPNATMFAGSKIVPAQAAWASLWRLHGSATANTCCATWVNCQGSYFMGDGAYVANSDDNLFINPIFNRTTSGTPTGVGFAVHGSTLAGGAGSARNNHWISGSPGAGGATFYGTDSFSYTAPASANIWDRYQVANGEPLPVTGTGAGLQWTANGLLDTGYTPTYATTNQSITTANTIIQNTMFVLPPLSIRVGLRINWRVFLSKSAAGTARNIAIKYGTAGVAATDTTIASLAYTGTAVADTGIYEIEFLVTGPLGATTNAVATSEITGSVLTTTGFATTAAARQRQNMGMATFNNLAINPGPGYLYLAIIAITGETLTILPLTMGTITKAANP